MTAGKPAATPAEAQPPALVVTAGSSHITYAVWADGTVYTQEFARGEYGHIDTDTEPTYAWYELDDISLDAVLKLAHVVVHSPEVQEEINNWYDVQYAIGDPPTLYLKQEHKDSYASEQDWLVPCYGPCVQSYVRKKCFVVDQLEDKLKPLSHLPSITQMKQAAEMYVRRHTLTVQGYTDTFQQTY